MNKQIHITYINIAGAYDSVPLERMYNTLTVYGFPLNLVNLIRNMYMDNTISIFTNYGKTDPIHITQGIRQGDPLSPLLFNIFVNPIIKKLHQNKSGYQMESRNIIGAIAFADDIAILSETADGMNKLWMELSKFCQDSRLQIKATKSAYTTNDVSSTFTPITNKGNQVEKLKPEGTYQYLGIHMALDLKWDTHIHTINKKFNQIINGLYHKQITASQKTHLINVITSMVVEYGMSIVNYTTPLLWKIDIIMKKVVKHALQIRRDCPSNWLWMEMKDRGMGLTCMENMQDAVFLGCAINQVLKGPDSLGQRAIINNMSCI